MMKGVSGASSKMNTGGKAVYRRTVILASMTYYYSISSVVILIVMFYCDCFTMAKTANTLTSSCISFGCLCKKVWIRLENVGKGWDGLCVYCTVHTARHSRRTHDDLRSNTATNFKP